MFLCVSANPAIDQRLKMEDLRRGQVNRVQSVEAFAGGKAAHVAMVLRTLGAEPQWVGPCGGATGQKVLNGLLALGIRATGIPIQQETRTNLEIREKDGTLTEVLAPGPILNAEESTAFESKCKELFAQGGERLSVIFSGSLPRGADVELYARLITAAGEQKCKTLLDTSGEALRIGLSAKPSFAKPNREEVSRLLGMEGDSLSARVAAARKLLQLGAQTAAISLGRDGLLYCAGLREAALYARGIPVKCCSAVGCGDSAVAGFAQGMAAHLRPEETVRLAAACATANCLADSPGAARLADIRMFQEQVSVQKLEVTV
jgi:tagatose 6-phosphate kinase